ncbi:hypothetical protein DMENIID0001_114120 [Sergentomyia squamirostris]
MGRCEGGRVVMFRQMMELVRICEVFNDVFGTIIAIFFVYQLFCACVDSYFIYWQLFDTTYTTDDIVFIMAGIIWVGRIFILVFYMTFTCDVFTTQVENLMRCSTNFTLDCEDSVRITQLEDAQKRSTASREILCAALNGKYFLLRFHQQQLRISAGGLFHMDSTLLFMVHNY